MFPCLACGPDQADLLGWYGVLPVRQAARGRRLPLAEDRGWRDAFVGGRILGAARRARLAACPRETGDGRPDASQIIVAALRRSESGASSTSSDGREYALICLWAITFLMIPRRCRRQRAGRAGVLAQIVRIKGRMKAILHAHLSVPTKAISSASPGSTGWSVCFFHRRNVRYSRVIAELERMTKQLPESRSATGSE
ncbi:hypothetical protein ACVIHF_000623 [Bradyrhizobium sp. USDA 4506]